jgi:hypothetical protein
MSAKPMGLHERIRRAIREPVNASEKLLDELQDADDETKLSILISGWGRGLAAGLEELAIALDAQQRQPATAESALQAPQPEPEQAAKRGPEEREHTRAEFPDADEEQLLEEAKRSREKTAEVREQTKSGLG